jgi:CopG family transcriptional regulator, nickel-responsive regulator
MWRWTYFRDRNGRISMQRTTIAIDDDLASALDAYMASTGATSLSETIRDLVRRGLSARPKAPADAHCFGVVSCTVGACPARPS